MVAGSTVEFVVLEQDPGVAKPGAGDEEKIEDGALVRRTNISITSPEERQDHYFPEV